MKKIRVLGTTIILMTMLLGCGSTTYTLKFDNVNHIVVVNKSTEKEVNLTKEQISTVTEELAKITFEDSNEDLGDQYLYKVSMSSGIEDAQDIYIYDSTHMKMDNKFYTAIENEFNLVFYKAMFQ